MMETCAVTAMEEACLDRVLSDRHRAGSDGCQPRSAAGWWTAAGPVLSWLQRVDGLLFQTEGAAPRLTHWGAAMLCRILEALFLDTRGSTDVPALALLPPDLADWLQNRLVPTILGQPPNAFTAVAIPPLWPLDPIQQALVSLLLRLMAPATPLPP